MSVFLCGMGFSIISPVVPFLVKLYVSNASEHAKFIWLPIDYLETLSWAPADVPAVKQLVSEK